MVKLFQHINNFIYLYPLLMSVVWMVGGIVFFWRYERKNESPPELKEFPFFSILIPCHNEQDQIQRTIEQLLILNYHKYEIIIIDDGSTDSTAQLIKDLCKEHENIRGVYFKENQGKAAALNIGVLVSKGELLLTIDADALVSPDALRWIAPHFVKYPRVGAVTGNPRIINRTSLLGKIQTGEYTTIIGLIKRTQRLIGKVLTVSGVLAAFRKTALHSAGYWDTDMVTEDIDITWKLEKKFWDVRYEPSATCWVYVPETLKGLWRQRMRWSQGGVEVLKKHKDIWKHWRQRRLWPVFFESAVSVVWSYCFWAMFILWVMTGVFHLALGVKPQPPLPPQWTGSILALSCVMQFFVSLYVDRSYEKGIFRYLFWVIWYPFLYWMLSSLTVLFATPKAMFKKKGVRAVWKSPDRGLQSLGREKNRLKGQKSP
ncbi:MAG: poly-beta-1,6 N-acetyl-D-glucosamine synthase [Desulfobacteraceae bacterium]|nr:poly-beta-1,6 N-acetyl-D-glucosamine synthase [Desulfobacteraceae bacterium]